MTLHSASCSLKHTENTPITSVWKVCLSVSRQCLSRPIERRNLWERATSIRLVLVSETRTVLTIIFLQSPKLKKWSIERGNLWEKSLELLRSEIAPVYRWGLCLMNRDKWSSQNVARKFLIMNSKQLKQNKIVQILQEELWHQQKDFREVHQQNLTEMEELRKFQSSTFDMHTKLIEDQNTIMELSGRLQELQNEVNCMNDSKDFQDAESVRSGNSHVTSQPRLFFKHPIPEGLLRPLFVSPRRKEGLPDICDTPGFSGNVFCKPTGFPLQILILKNWIHGGKSLKNRFICPQRRRVIDQNEIKIWDASLDRQPKIQSSSVEETIQRIMGQDQQRLQISDLHFDKFPTPATFACWKIRFKTGVCTCSQFLTEAMQWIKEVELVDSVDELRSSSSIRGISMPNFEVLDARFASALNKIIHNSQFKRRISLEEQKAQKEDRFLRGRQIAYLIYDHFRVTGSHDSVENYTDLFTIFLRNDGYSGIRF